MNISQIKSIFLIFFLPLSLPPSFAFSISLHIYLSIYLLSLYLSLALFSFALYPSPDLSLSLTHIIFLFPSGLADGRLNVWYQPFVAFTDKDLVPLTTSSAEAKGERMLLRKIGKVSDSEGKGNGASYSVRTCSC